MPGDFELLVKFAALERQVRERELLERQLKCEHNNTRTLFTIGSMDKEVCMDCGAWLYRSGAGTFKMINCRT